jgi:hypothetical protein
VEILIFLRSLTREILGILAVPRLNRHHIRLQGF